MDLCFPSWGTIYRDRGSPANEAVRRLIPQFTVRLIKSIGNMPAPENTPPASIDRFCRQFERIFIISLPRSADRREYISNYFKEIGISNYEFFDATDHSDEAVAQYYNNGLVATYPPCFRCHQYTCGRDDCNNVLIPPQVATFITYLRLWKEMVESNTKTALIMEDDVRFVDYAADAANAVVSDNILQKVRFVAEKPVLLRFGWAWSGDHKPSPKLSVSKGVIKMSNPCHAITHSFAKLLLSRFRKIETTVDIYQHQIVGSGVDNFTLFPPLAYELSWSVGAFDSLIHPKSLRVSYLEKYHPAKTAHIESAKQALQNHIKHILYRPLLIVGHPRCGSGYMSKLLQAMGLDVGHEKMGRHGISSWMFAVVDDEVPYALDKYAISRKFTYFQFTVHHVRDPRTAIPSIMRENKHSPKSFQFRRKHIKHWYGIDLEDHSSEIERAALSYIYWNNIIEKNGVAAVVRVEDEEDKLVEFLLKNGVIGRKPILTNRPSRDINSRKPYHGVVYEKPDLKDEDWAGMRPDILDALNAQCAKYGYQKFDVGMARQA